MKEEELLELIKSDSIKNFNDFDPNIFRVVDWKKIMDSINKTETKNCSENLILGYLYARGIFVDANCEKSIYYYQLSAEKGNVVAQSILGYNYHTGKKIEIDYQKAIYYYQLAAKQNNSVAQYNLGCMYENGLGVKKDCEIAKKYYELAIINGKKCKIANNNIGHMYQNSIGVEKDISKAILHYQIADNYDAIYDILCNEKNMMIDICKKKIELEKRNEELENEVKQLKNELDCIPEYGCEYFNARKHFEENRN